MRVVFCIVLFIAVISFTVGCDDATYPKEKLKESLIKLCQDEYDLKIDAEIFGKTLAVYLPVMGLFDVTLNLSESAQEKVQDILLGASRIALSTDADIQFYCVITQDVRLPQIQLVIIKYVNDVKRAFFHDISRSEYFKRTLIDINENPQAKKEQAIVDVFGKMELEKDMQEKVLDDFFRSPPSSLEGMGYWNGKFYIKDITLREFLAQQIASRIKMKFREEPFKKYNLKSITGKFIEDIQERFFLITFRAEGLLFIYDTSERESMEKEIFKNAFMEASDVIYGYKFNDFNFIKIIEENYNRKLSVSKENLYLFKKRKLAIDSILGTIN